MRVRFFCGVMLFSSLAFNLYGAGIIPPGTSSLNDKGTPANPAMWRLGDNYVSPAGEFTVGGFGRSWNHLTIDSSYTFTASEGMNIGYTGSHNNLLDIQAGGVVSVNGNFRCGYSNNIGQTSLDNKTMVSGTGARLEVTGDLLVGVGAAWLVKDNTLNISSNGVVIVDSDKDGTGSFGLSNNRSYGNSWLELNGGLLAVWGDKTADFAQGQGILTSIKVWDDLSGSFKRVAQYVNQTPELTQYFGLLSVEYVQDAAEADLLGVSGEFVGFTVIRNVPEPATLMLLILGGFALRAAKRKA